MFKKGLPAVGYPSTHLELRSRFAQDEKADLCRSAFSLPARHPQATLIEVAFPIYPYRVSRGEYRISLHPIEKTQKIYRNPLLLALGYKEALDSQKYPSQTALARSLNVTPSRLNQYLRLLDLPESVQEEVLREKIRPSERQLRGLLAGKTTLPQP